MKTTALILGAVALALLALFLLRLGSAPGSPAAPETEVSASGSRSLQLVPAESPLDEARTIASEPAAIDPVVERPLGSPSALAAAGTLSLAGTIVVVDDQGIEHRAEDGSFSFVLWTGDSGAWHKVQVAGGAWRTEIPLEPTVLHLGVNGVRLGGRVALPDDAFEDRFALPADGWLAITARWPRASILHVRDRASGRELAPVLVAETDDDSELEHPGITAAAARDLGPSPAELPAPDSHWYGPRTVQACSPGYAWGKIEIDFGRGGERILMLDPAGELEVVLSGEVGDPGAKLRLFRSEYQPVFEVAAQSASPVLVDALAPGNYRATVQIGDYWDEPILVAEDAVEVTAGARARLTLVLKPIDARARVEIDGTLALPASWELHEFELAFELLGTPLGGGSGRFWIESSEMQPVGEPPETWRWSASGVQPGRYEVELDELAFLAVLDVPDTGLHDARVVVSPPCDVLVRCVDEDTGADVTTERITWHCAIPEGVDGWSNESATWDGGARRWRIRAPQGEVSVSAHGSTYVHMTETIQARPGVNEVLMRLARLTSLEVILRDGETVIPWGDESPELEAAEGQEEYWSSTSGGGRITLHRKQPGRYRLKIPEIPGYEPVPEVEVRLEKGVVKEHVVELVRKP